MTERTDNTPLPEQIEPTMENEPEAFGITAEVAPELRRFQVTEQLKADRQVVAERKQSTVERAQKILADSPEQDDPLQQMVEDLDTELEELDVQEAEALADLDSMLDQLSDLPDNELTLVTEDDESEQSIELSEQDLLPVDDDLVQPPIAVDEADEMLQELRTESARAAELTPIPERITPEQLWETIAQAGPDDEKALNDAANLVLTDDSQLDRLPQILGHTQVVEVLNRVVSLNPEALQNLPDSLQLSPAESEAISSSRIAAQERATNWRIMSEPRDIADLIREYPSDAAKLDELNIPKEQRREIATIMLEEHPGVLLEASQYADLGFNKSQLETMVERAKNRDRANRLVQIRQTGTEFAITEDRVRDLLSEYPEATQDIAQLELPNDSLLLALSAAAQKNGEVLPATRERATELGLSAADLESIQQKIETEQAKRKEWAAINEKLREGGEAESAGVQLAIELISNDYFEAGRLDQAPLSDQQRREIGAALEAKNPFIFLNAAEHGDFKLTEQEREQKTVEYVTNHEGGEKFFGKAIFALRLSKESIERTLEQLGDKSKLVLERLRINQPEKKVTLPEEATPKSAQETWRQKLETNDEARVEYQKIIGAKNAEQALRLALEQEAPNRVEELKKKAEVEQILSGDIVEIQEMIDINNPQEREKARTAPQRVFFEGRPLPAILKSKNREMTANTMRQSIEAGSMYMREWLAYQVDKAFGLDLVPTTVARNSHDGPSIAQEWVISESEDDKRFLHEAATNPRAKMEMARLAMLGTAISDSDCAAQNWAKKPDQKALKYDNGAAFVDRKNDGPFDALRCWPLWAVSGQQLPESLQKKITDFQDSPKTTKALKTCFTTALGTDGERAWNDFTTALDKMLKEGYPINETDISEEEQRARKMAM